MDYNKWTSQELADKFWKNLDDDEWTSQDLADKFWKNLDGDEWTKGGKLKC